MRHLEKIIQDDCVQITKRRFPIAQWHVEQNIGPDLLLVYPVSYFTCLPLISNKGTIEHSVDVRPATLEHLDSYLPSIPLILLKKITYGPRVPVCKSSALNHHPVGIGILQIKMKDKR